jgi:hypothetical protein
MKTIRKYFLPVCIILLLAMASCQKTSGGNEENLSVETLPLANGHVEASAPGPDFPLKVTVKSAMPPGGVKISVTAKIDGGTLAFFNTSKTSSSAVTDITITGTPSGVVSVVDITVTSASTATNKWSGSYKYSRK